MNILCLMSITKLANFTKGDIIMKANFKNKPSCLDKCKNVAYEWLNSPIFFNQDGTINHPIFNERYYCCNGIYIDLCVSPNQRKAIANEKREIANCANVGEIIFRIIRKQYWGEFFKDVADYIYGGDKEYGRLLSNIWYFTGDEKLKLSDDDWCMLFRKANKRCLMDKDEYKIYESLPDMVTLYRGSINENAKALSYTTEHDIAKWFALRYTKKGDTSYIIKTTIPKSAIFMFCEGENECVVDAHMIENYEVEKITNTGEKNEFPLDLLYHSENTIAKPLEDIVNIKI